MNIYQGCFIDLLEKHGYIPEYVDSHQIDAVTYYFGGVGGFSIKFVRSCIPAEVAFGYLDLFPGLFDLDEFQEEKCHCDW